MRAHSGLMGNTPGSEWEGHRCDPVTIDELARALTVRDRRRVRRDSTVPVGGVDWEVEQGFLAGRLVTIARTLAEPASRPWIEHESVRYDLAPVDPKANARRGRKAFRPKPGIDAVAFDPAGVFLDAAVGRPPRHDGGAQ